MYGKRIGVFELTEQRFADQCHTFIFSLVLSLYLFVVFLLHFALYEFL